MIAVATAIDVVPNCKVVLAMGSQTIVLKYHVCCQISPPYTEISRTFSTDVCKVHTPHSSYNIRSISGKVWPPGGAIVVNKRLNECTLTLNGLQTGRKTLRRFSNIGSPRQPELNAIQNVSR